MVWDWYTHPMHDGHPYTREHQPLMQKEEAGFSGGFVTIRVGSSLCSRAHQPRYVMTPPKSLHPTYP